MIDDILKAATVERKETFEEILLRVQSQVRCDGVIMKCSNCDFEAFEKEDYYNHIVENHSTDDSENDEEGTLITLTVAGDSKNSIDEEETFRKELEPSREVEPMEDNTDEDRSEASIDEEQDVVQMILDSILERVIDVAAKRKEWEKRQRNILTTKNPNLLFSTLGSSQEPFDEEENGESESEEEENSEDSDEENDEEKKKEPSTGLDSLEILKEQEKYLLDNIVKDLVELESLEIGIVGEKTDPNIKEEKNVKEGNFWGEDNVTDFQDQYQIFAENLINPTEKKNSKRRKLKAMNKEKKKLKRMEDENEGDEDEEEEWNDLSATSSKVLRALLASPPDSIGRCDKRQNKSDWE